MTEQMEIVAKGLVAISKRHNKAYCWVSLSHLQTLLCLYDNWNMSERTLRRRIKNLADQGYIKVIHRNWSEENGTKRFKSNLYILTKKIFLWLEKGMRYARQVLSFFRRPKLAIYSSLNPRRDLREVPPTVEFLWKTQEKGRASPF